MFQQKLEQQMLQQTEKEIEHLQSKKLEYEGLSELYRSSWLEQVKI